MPEKTTPVISRYAVGIDFGTTKSALAFINMSASGTAAPRLVKMSSSADFMPSAIYVSDGEDGRVQHVGRHAQDCIRSSIAKSAKDASALQEAVRRYFTQFKMDLDSQAVGARYETLDVSPASLTACLLYAMLGIAERGVLKSGGPIENATITVPSGWGEVAKGQTKKAARAAGLDSCPLIKEPTAALHYIDYDVGLFGKGDQKIIIVDYGGGTCDVTACKIPATLRLTEKGDILAESTRGVGVGGRNIDHALADRFKEWAKSTCGVSITALERIRPLIEMEAERCKENYVEWLQHWKRRGHQPPRMQILDVEDLPPLDMEMSTDVFDSAANPVVKQLRTPIDEVLEKAHCKPEDIDKVYMVGGSSLLPAAQAEVQEIFPKKMVLISSPREAVCYGAALWQYYQMAGVEAEPRFQPRRYSTLSIPHQKRSWLPWGPGGTTETVLVRAGSRLADLQKSQTLVFRTSMDTQQSLELNIVESGIEGTPDRSDLYAATTLRFPKPMPRNTRVEIRWYVDWEDRLQLTAEVVGRDGSRENVSVTGHRSVSEESITNLRRMAGIDRMESGHEPT